jgi:hypothetical protein
MIQSLIFDNSAHLLEGRPPNLADFSLDYIRNSNAGANKDPEQERVTMRHGASAVEGAEPFGSAQSQQSN